MADANAINALIFFGIIAAGLSVLVLLDWWARRADRPER